MDDFTPYGDDFEPSLQTVEKVLEICIATRLCLSHEKCHMMMTEGLILGHYISTAGIQVDPSKIQVILLLPTPCTQTEVCSFLGFSGYYQRFIKNFSHFAAPLYALTGNIDFIRTNKCDISFEELKWLVSIAPVLRGPNWDLPFQTSSDALDMDIGAVLCQQEDMKPYAIYYISKSLTPVELNYTVAEKEFLAVINAINKFRHYITGYSPYHLVFGKEPIFPIEFEIQTLRIAQEVELDLNEAQVNRLHQINELDEIWLLDLHEIALIQQQREKWHDALINKNIFHEGD